MEAGARVRITDAGRYEAKAYQARAALIELTALSSRGQPAVSSSRWGYATASMLQRDS